MSPTATFTGSEWPQLKAMPSARTESQLRRSSPLPVSRVATFESSTEPAYATFRFGPLPRSCALPIAEASALFTFTVWKYCM
jgi:hypothetical protein